MVQARVLKRVKKVGKRTISPAEEVSEDESESSSSVNVTQKRGLRQKICFQEPTNFFESMDMMKEVIRVSIFQICYLRSLFPEAAFCDHMYADMNVKFLVSTQELPETKTAMKDALFLRSWLEEGAFVALEKDYLEKIEFCIYGVSKDLKPDKILERYTFKLRSLQNGLSMTTNFSKSSFDTSNSVTVKSQAISLIRSLISITNALQTLPDNRLLTVKLQYNESCPPHWQPKYFKQSTLDLREDFEKCSLTLDVGQILSQFHILSMKLEAPDEVFTAAERALAQETQPEELIDADISSFSEDAAPSTTSYEECAAAPVSNQSNTSTSQLSLHSGPASQSFIELASMKEEIMKYCIQFESIQLSKIQEHFKIDKHCLSELLDEWSAEKVFHSKPTVPDTYLVGAYQGVNYWRAIKFIHGNLRRSISASALSKHLNCSVSFAKSILLRMGYENLIDMSIPPSFKGYPVRYDESTRQVIQNATEKINAPENKRNISQAVGNSTIAHASSSSKPIVQTMQSSKKRRLSIKAA